jgi:hypothetical protein
MLVDPRDLPPVKGLESLSGLGRPQITAIAKGRGYIARLGSLQPGVLARERAKAPRPMEPIFCVGQDIEDIDGLEPLRDQPLQGFEPARDGAGSQARSTGSPSTSRTAVLVGKWASTVAARSANSVRICCTKAVLSTGRPMWVP